MNSIILRTVSTVIVNLLYLLSVYFFLRGHHAPGGGFIGGLLVVVAMLVLVFADLFKLSWNIARYWILFGLLSLIFCVIFPMLFEQSPLTAAWWYVKNVAIGTPMLFDFGVYCIAIGSGTMLIKTILEDKIHE